MSTPTTILYQYDHTAAPAGLQADAVYACLAQAAAEWNRVLKGMVSIVPYNTVASLLGDPTVLVKFGHSLPASEDGLSRVWAVQGKLRPGAAHRWKIELRDDQPPLPWFTPKYGGCRVLWRKVAGMPLGVCVTAVLLHELGHVLQLPHDEPAGLIMSHTAPMVETISAKETKRYRQYFTDHVWARQNG